MCFTCWLRSGFSNFMNVDSLSFTWALVIATDIRLVLTTFKITNLFNVKDAVPEVLARPWVGVCVALALRLHYFQCNRIKFNLIFINHCIS